MRAPSVVLMTADAVGGVWTYAMELSRALAADRVLVVLATMGPRPSAAQREEARSIGNVELHESNFALEWMPDPWEDVARAGDWLLGLCERVKPDLVHLSSYAHGALPWPVPTVMVAHSCVLSWHRAARGKEAGGEWDRYRDEVTRGLASASRVVAPTRAMLSSISQDYGPLPPSVVIPNARNPRLFPPVHAADKEPVIMAAGRLWDEAKNLRALISVAPRIAWAVRVAGALEPGERVTEPHGSPLPPSVQALGLLAPQKLFAELSRAAIFAHPARYEPFGLGVLEAAMSGCALVLGDIPSLRETWDEVACFVPPDDEDALAATLDDLARNPGRRARLAAAARDRALTFSPARMSARYLALYRAMLDERAGANALESPCA